LSYDEFAHDHILHGAAEREFQVAIQAALDIASIILADLSVEVPGEYREIFPRLADVGVITSEFARKLAGMAKFRNVLVHLYLEVDLQRVYQYLQNDLGDFELFAQAIAEYLHELKG
jgi:uncharacterized protein YutE (UPF0331/DUF86 family)